MSKKMSEKFECKILKENIINQSYIVKINGEISTIRLIKQVEKTIENPLINSPNDVVLINENQFYFTNDHKYTKGIGRLFEDYLGLALSNVIYFDGKNFKEVSEMKLGGKIVCANMNVFAGNDVGYVTCVEQGTNIGPDGNL